MTQSVGGRFRGRGEEGAALVEFAIVSVALLTLVFGVIDLGRAYFTWQSVKNAAREGAAYAERNPLAQKPSGTTCPDPDNIQYRARTEEGKPNTHYSVKVTPAIAGGCASPSDNQAIKPGDTVTVRVSTSFTMLTPFVSAIVGGSMTITASQQVVVQG
jgi:Flp pilus assembly protein TadG